MRIMEIIGNIGWIIILNNDNNSKITQFFIEYIQCQKLKDYQYIFPD